MKLLSLIKKEFHRFFHDPRLIVTILLPGLIIFALYSILGSAIHGEEGSKQYKLAVLNQPAVVEMLRDAVKENDGSEVEIVSVASAEEGKGAVERGEAHVFVAFSEGFDLSPMGASAEIWYNAVEEDSLTLFQLTSSFLQSYGLSFLNFQVTANSVIEGQDLGRTIMAEMLPFLVVTLIFSACMSVTLESVAGEKERGTLATILATSVPRVDIALGKVLPLSCIAAIGAASSFFGVIFSLPKLMGVSVGALAGGYGFTGYLLLFLLILSVVPLIVAAIAAVSTLAKSVKVASGYTSILMILVMVISVVSGFAQLGDWVISVPVLNAVVLIGRLLGGETVIWQALVSIAANLAYTGGLVCLMSAMLSSERIMFGK